MPAVRRGGESGEGREGQRTPLTRKSFDGFHGPLLVGAVHKGIAGLDQELPCEGNFVVVEDFLQVGRSHVLV